MTAAAFRLGAVATLWCGVCGAASLARAQDEAVGIPVARIEYVAGTVEVLSPGGAWTVVAAGDALKTADKLRAGTDGLARITFPWMTLTLSPSSLLSTPSSRVLSVTLESGRLRIESEEDIIKLMTGEAEVRGRGMAVVRRTGTNTVVGCLAGSFHVSAEGTRVELDGGQGSVVAAGHAPGKARSLPPAPEPVSPAEDPVYVHPGDPVELRWTPEEGGHQIEVLGVDSDEVLLEAEAGASPHTIRIPWLGTYRWRVTTRDPDGLEGLPSGEGLVCVVEDY